MTNITRRGVLAGASLILGGALTRAQAQPEIESLFGGRTGTFVGYDFATGARDVAFPELAATRDAPFSTFKIWNTLISVDAKVANGPQFKIAWDRERDPPQEHWPDSWKQDHTLATAYKNSCVWYYQELARRIGPERMQAKLTELNFGNADISGGIDQFWLNSSLRISPTEEVEQLVKLAKNEAPFSGFAVDTLRAISIYEQKSTYTMRAKTGGGPNGRGWFVGWIEHRITPLYAFATLVHGKNFADVYEPRIDITRAILAKLNRWPPA